MERKQSLERRLKILVAVIILGFIVQELLIYNVFAEPYPALRMPPFAGNNMNEDNQYETSSLEIKIYFSEGDSLTVKPRTFFADAPNSHHRVLSKKFQLTSASVAPLVESEQTILRSVVPGYFISRNRSLYEVQHAPETKRWLKERVAQLAPNQIPTMISFQWFQETYDLNQLLTPERSLLGSTNIELQ